VTSEPAVAALERELAVMLRRARAFSDEMARTVHPELEAAAYGLLMHVVDSSGQDESGVRAADLADYFGIDKSTVSRQVRLLESLGLLARTTDPQDARSLRLVPTEEGLRRLQTARQARRTRVLSRVHDWTDDEVAELARLLARFNAGHV
jgi:DNA-binding MarR family transcriptional regulator